MEPSIVPSSEKLALSFWRCLDTVARERKYLLFIEAPPLESTLEFVRKNVAQQIPQYFAVVKDEVVGWADIKPNENPLLKHRANLGMGVHPDFRGQGIGPALLRACLTQAREVGIEKVELWVYGTNERAFRMYKKFGFVEEGRVKDYRKLDGKYEDSLLMGLFL